MTIFLYTDFGAADLYVGQVKAVLAGAAPGVPVVDLLNEVPAFAIAPAAHLLPALAAHTPPGSVVMAIVDPGVGGPREAVVLVADGRWYVGPDNGLLSVVAQRAAACVYWRITWRPENLSTSFHGRDLFAPIAALIAKGAFPAERLAQVSGLDMHLPSEDLAAAIYIDHYGNVMTGLRAAPVPRTARVLAGQQSLGYARTFSEAPPGAAFWYENSLGLVECAANQASAATLLGLRVGDSVALAP
jgi:S-adenosylmethionine hydrolase